MESGNERDFSPGRNLYGVALVFREVVTVKLVLVRSPRPKSDCRRPRVYSTPNGASEDGNWGSHTRSAIQAPRGRLPKCFSM